MHKGDNRDGWRAVTATNGAGSGWCDGWCLAREASGATSLHGAEALGPTVGDESGVKLVYETGALIDAARQHANDLKQVIREVKCLRHDLSIEVVHEALAHEQCINEALELAVLVRVWYVWRLFHGHYGSSRGRHSLSRNVRFATSRSITIISLYTRMNVSTTLARSISGVGLHCCPPAGGSRVAVPLLVRECHADWIASGASALCELKHKNGQNQASTNGDEHGKCLRADDERRA